jgi:hypothetical protein
MVTETSTRSGPEEAERKLLRRDRLARYATWTPDEFAQVEEAVAAQRLIDHKDAEASEVSSKTL